MKELLNPVTKVTGVCMELAVGEAQEQRRDDTEDGTVPPSQCLDCFGILLALLDEYLALFRLGLVTVGYYHKKLV